MPRLAREQFARNLFPKGEVMKGVIGRPRSQRQTASESGHILTQAGRAPGAARCRRKFLRFFPRGFADQKYVNWERGYKIAASSQWQDQLDRATFEQLLDDGAFA